MALKDRTHTTSISPSFVPDQYIYDVNLEWDDEYEGVFTEGRYFKVYPSGVPEVYADAGELKKISSDKRETKTEYVVFAESKEESLGDFPVNTPTVLSWTGTGSPTFARDKVKFNEKKVGVLKLEYEVSFDRYHHKFTLSEKYQGEPEKCVIIGKKVFYEGSPYEEVSMDHLVHTNPETGDRRDVTIKVVDACTGDPVPDATVEINNGMVFSGTTDENGEVVVSDLLIGEEYQIFTNANNYVASDQDTLDNDTFTVEEEESEE